jgi:hypothetical protein
LLSSSFHIVKVEAGQAALISGTRSCGSGHTRQARLEFKKNYESKIYEDARHKKKIASQLARKQEVA